MACCTSSSCPREYAVIFAGVLVLLYFSILFLQSGFDKVSDRKGNLEWLRTFFANSPFRGREAFLLTLLTLQECLAGLISLVGIPFLFIGNKAVGLAGIGLAAVSLLSVFLGQRLAKDYAGSAATTGYLLFTLVSLLLFILL